MNRRGSDFGLFWLAQAISRFGDPVTLIALATVTYIATSSALFTALAVVIATVPTAVFGFFAGAVAAAATSMPADGLHVTLTGATALKPLADVIAVPIARAVYSIGDVCIALGGFLVPFVLLIRR